MQKIHTQHGLDFQELYDLVRNKVSWKNCESCDANGRQYYDSSTGEGLSKSPSGIDKEWLECTSCEDCGGLGFILFTIEESK